MTAPREHRLCVTRTARYYTLGTTTAVRDLWFVCHGYGQLAGPFIQQFEPIAAPGRLIVAPEALSRYYTNHAAREVGATWMTREDRLSEIDDYVRYLDALHEHVAAELDGAERPRVRVLGFSQGVHTASRWVAFGSVRPDQLILWASPAPPDLDPTLLAGKLRAPLVFVAGTRDKMVTASTLEAERERLGDAGVALDFRTFDGGHRLDDDALRALATALPPREEDR